MGKKKYIAILCQRAKKLEKNYGFIKRLEWNTRNGQGIQYHQTSDGNKAKQPN